MSDVSADGSILVGWGTKLGSEANYVDAWRARVPLMNFIDLPSDTLLIAGEDFIIHWLALLLFSSIPHSI